MVKNPQLRIVILDYQKAERVITNVKSLQQQKTNFSFEIEVLDNSVDQSNAEKLKKLEGVRLTIHDQNTGYSRGNNQGAKNFSGDYLVFVNPDIVWPNPDSLQKMVDYLEAHPEVVILGPHQINEPSKSSALTVRRFPHLLVQIARRTYLRNLPLIKKFIQKDECQDFDYAKTQAVDWLQSSCIVVRRSFWEEVGGFDERYFIFMADTELCYQAWKKGHQVVYFADTQVMADGVRCSDGTVLDLFRNRILRWHLKDAWKYFLAHAGSSNPRK